MADDGWRYAIAFSGVACLIYGVIYWFVVSDTPEGKIYRKTEKNICDGGKFI
ncbi:hypothetical protein KHA80_18100 [Anaerobacillus sp. HL2]|nr:hypothetical protein KHA80_18100 [Anaerobacillus sp. HL2]